MSTASPAIFASTPTPPGKTREVLVTPDMAKNALAAHNTHNRGVVKGTVTTLARDMTNGDYYFGVAIIALSGKLGAPGTYVINGQHTLLAIAESGIAQWIILVEGVHPEAQEAFDTQRKRTGADAITLLDGEEKYQGRKASLSQTLLRYERGQRGNNLIGQAGSGGAPSVTEIRKYYEAHKAEIDEAVIWTSIFKKSSFTGADRVWGLWWVVTNRIDAGDADTFWDGLEHGVGLTETDPIWRLREKLKGQVIRGNPESIRMLELLSYTWAAHRDRRTWPTSRSLRATWVEPK